MNLPIRVIIAVFLITTISSLSIFLIHPTKANTSTSYCSNGDLNCDGKITLADLQILISLFGKQVPQADLNGDGKVNAADAGKLVLQLFGQPPANDTDMPSMASDPLEVIPDFCTSSMLPNTTTIIKTVKTGNWSDPAVWSGGQVPGTGNNSGAAVQVTAGNTVYYDESPTNDVSLNCLKVFEGGAVRFKNNMDTKLTVGTLTDYGYFEVGSFTSPIPAQYKAEIVINDLPLQVDPANPASSKDPNQWGTGIIVRGNGRFIMYGDPKTNDTNISNASTHAFIRLAAEPHKGDTTLSLTEDVNSYHWLPGDTIILPDSREAPASPWVMLTQNYPLYNEYLVIKSVSSDGKTITLTAPLAGDHPGAYNANGTLEFLPHVGDLTRNIIVHSAPGANYSFTTPKGHMMVTERGYADIRYTEWDDMGRTNGLVPIDPTTYDSNGVPTKIGTNVKAKYTIHFHHDSGPKRSGSALTDPAVYQGILVGNAMTGSSKWCIDLHMSSYDLIKDNTLTQCEGAGINFESGFEYKNIVEGNFIADVRGVPNAGPGEQVDPEFRAMNNPSTQDFGFEGTGIWDSSPFNYIRNNVVASTKAAGFELYLNYEESVFQRLMPMIPSVNFTSPQFNIYPENPNMCHGSGTDYRGANMDNMNEVSMVNGCQGMLQFSNNEAYGTMLKGVDIWGGDATTLDSTKIWNTNASGMQLHYIVAFSSPATENGAVKITNSTILGDKNVLSTSDVDSTSTWNREDSTPIGIMAEQFQYANDIDIENNDIENEKAGIFLGGTGVQIKNNTLKNYENIWIYEAQARYQRNIYINNNDFYSIPNLTLTTAPPRDIYAAVKPADWICDGSTLGPNPSQACLNDHWNEVTHPDFIRIYNYKSNGQALGDFRLYFLEQAPDFNLKQVDDAAKVLTGWPNMTNQQFWNTYGSAVGDALAPCSTQMSSVRGFMCPIDTTYTTYSKTDGSGPNPIANSLNPNPSPIVMQYVFGTEGGCDFHEQTNLDKPCQVLYKVNDGTYVGTTVLSQTITPVMGVNYVTVTDADIPASQQLQVLDLNKNGIIDPWERYKKTFILYRTK